MTRRNNFDIIQLSDMTCNTDGAKTMSPVLTYRAAVYPHMNRRPIQRKLDGVWPGIGCSASYN